LGEPLFTVSSGEAALILQTGKLPERTSPHWGWSLFTQCRTSDQTDWFAINIRFDNEKQADKSQAEIKEGRKAEMAHNHAISCHRSATSCTLTFQWE
jgi:hypothetical protein